MIAKAEGTLVERPKYDKKQRKAEVKGAPEREGRTLRLRGAPLAPPAPVQHVMARRLLPAGTDARASVARAALIAKHLFAPRFSLSPTIFCS